MTTTWNPKAPLERVQGVSRKSNQALRDYAMMGSGRSLQKLINSYRVQVDANPLLKYPTLRLATLKTWSLKYHWVARVDAWTAVNQERDEAEWIERRRQIRQDDWKLADRLRDLANKILDHSPPYFKRTVGAVKRGDTRVHRTENTKGETVIEKTRVDLQVVSVALDGHLMAKAAKAASDLGRLAAEVQPLPVKMEHAGAVTLVGIDPDGA